MSVESGKTISPQARVSMATHQRARYVQAMRLGPLWQSRHSAVIETHPTAEEPITVTPAASVQAADGMASERACVCMSHVDHQVNLQDWIYPVEGLQAGLLLVDVSAPANDGATQMPEPAAARRLLDNVVYAMSPDQLSWTVRLFMRENHSQSSLIQSSQHEPAVICPICVEALLAAANQQATRNPVPVLVLGSLGSAGQDCSLPSLAAMLQDNENKRAFWDRYTALLASHPALASKFAPRASGPV